MQYPLAGIRILDFSRVVAGPFASRLLSDLGADVVKVEPPEGDSTRLHGREVAGISGFYNHQNAGKRNICLDLRADGATALIHALAAEADIVIENYRPGVMQRLGIDYETLEAINPKILMLSISGYGQDGPESHKPSYAPVVHAEVGLMHRLADRNGTAPGDLPLSVADTNASLHGVIALLAALHMRDQTGLGQHIDMSMLDATFATDDRTHFEIEDVPDTLPHSLIFDLPFARVFLATDMKLLFRRLHRRAGLEDPTPENASLEEKIRVREQAVHNRLAGCSSLDEFSKLLDTLDLPWALVRDPRTLAEQTTLRHREMLVPLDDRAGGTRPTPQSPYRFSNAASGVRGPTAHRGEHNSEVLEEWLNLNTQRIEDLEEAGVLQREH